MVWIVDSACGQQWRLGLGNTNNQKHEGVHRTVVHPAVAEKGGEGAGCLTWPAID